jgi:tRNA (guanine-N7-)-methyltransferase
MRRAARLPAEELAPFLLEVGTPARVGSDSDETTIGIAPLDWCSVFSNANPVEIEVGFGKGLFLVNAGAAQPETNFFGIEIERKYALFTATRLAKRGLRNVKVAAADARWLLQVLVGTGSVAALHVYFPDPWWKNRHRKRRLFTGEFAIECGRVLECGGLLHLVSDVADYFEQTVEMLARIELFTALPPPAVKEPESDMDFLTNFERKYRRAGRKIFRGLWRKN